MTKVVVFYNPYLPELKITVNGRRLAEYSVLMSYRHQHFSRWGCELFTELYREINADYEVVCISNDFVCGQLEAMAENDPHCVSFSSEPLPFCEDVYGRLAKLEMLGCEESENAICIPLINASEYDDMTSAVFEILGEQGIFEECDEGLEWSECPLVELVLTPARSAYDLPCSVPCIFALCNSDRDRVSAHSEAPTYALVMGTETKFIRKSGNVLFFSVDPDDIGSFMISVIEEEVLCAVLSQMSYEFPSEAMEFLTDAEKEELRLVCEASAVCNVTLPTECFVGRTSDPSPEIYPSDSGIEWRVVSSAPEIIDMENGLLVPKMAGAAEIALYVGNDPYPSAEARVNVRDIALISCITTFPENLYMPVGEKSRVDIRVIPENAENRNEIVWDSSDTSVAEIDESTGVITAISSGKCVITASTPETSCRVNVWVRPRLEEISCPGGVIELGAGEQTEWSYTVVPHDAYGVDLLRVVSTDSTVAEYRGGYIVARNNGCCKICVKDASGTVLCESNVFVRRGRNGR